MEQQFYLVQVYNDAFKEHIVVPKIFIFHCSDMNKTFLRIMAPPYSEDDNESLIDFVKTMAKPPEDWPVYQCQLLKGAGYYTIIIQLLK